jgi:hypothetical protein
MQVLAGKVEWVLTMFLESMETDQGSTETRPFFQEEEYQEGKDPLNTNTHHTLIEPCW